MKNVIQLDKMTTADKLRAFEEIWDDLCRTPQEVPAPSWHQDVLAAREKRIREGSARFKDWADAKSDIRERTQMKVPIYINRAV